MPSSVTPISPWTGRASAALALVVLDLFELGVDDIVVATGRRFTAALLPGTVHALRQPAPDASLNAFSLASIALLLSPLIAPFKSANADSIFARSSPVTLSPSSRSDFSVACAATVRLIARVGKLAELRVLGRVLSPRRRPCV